MSDERTPLEKLDAAVREYAQSRAEGEGKGQVLVTASMLSYEQVWFDDDGHQVYQTRYVSPSLTTPATSLGLARAGYQLIERDLTRGDLTRGSDG